MGSTPFVPGQVYKRADIHAQYRGQAQGGISTPASHSIILLFSGNQGAVYSYRDTWREGGIYHYTGEGQVGDMVFLRGNLAIRDHARGRQGPPPL